MNLSIVLSYNNMKWVFSCGTSFPQLFNSFSSLLLDGLLDYMQKASSHSCHGKHAKYVFSKWKKKHAMCRILFYIYTLYQLCYWWKRKERKIESSLRIRMFWRWLPKESINLRERCDHHLTSRHCPVTTLMDISSSLQEFLGKH